MRGRVHMREVGVEQEKDKLYHLRAGEVPKWPKGAVSKTVSRCKPSRGSNPRFSASLEKMVWCHIKPFSFDSIWPSKIKPSIKTIIKIVIRTPNRLCFFILYPSISVNGGLPAL